MKIILNNSYSQIEGISDSDKKILWNKLAYESKNMKYMKAKNPRFFKFDTRKHLFSDKTNKFPTGLLYKVKELLSSSDIEIDDRRSRPEKSLYLSLNNTLPELRYYQKDCLEIAKKDPVCAFQLPTGTGKTLLVANIIKEIGVNTLVIVPSLSLLKQTEKVLQFAFGSKYVGTHKLPKLKQITIANVQALVRKEKDFFKDFDMVVIDEVHHAASKSYVDMNKKMWKHIYYRMYVSGTLWRNDGTDLELHGITGEISYNYPIKQAIKDGFLTPPIFFVYDIENDTTIKVGRLRLENKAEGDYHEIYNKYIVNNEERNNVIKLLSEQMSSPESTTLILVERIEHGEILNNIIQNSVYINGDMKDNYKVIEQFNLQNIEILIATSGIISEGVDIPSAQNLIIAGGYKAKSQVIQKIGRVLRLNDGKNSAHVIDFNDKNVKFLEKHSKQRVKIFKEYGTEIHLIK